MEEVHGSTGADQTVPGNRRKEERALCLRQVGCEDSAPTVRRMTHSDSPHQPSIAHTMNSVGRDAPHGIPGTPCAVAAAAFRAEIAALEGLDDRTFAEVVPHTRAPIVATVVGRGRLEP